MNATLWAGQITPLRLRLTGRALALCVLVAAGAAGCGSQWPGSVGAVFAKDNRAGRVFVREVPPDMPAGRAGIQEGDELVAVGGRSVRTMTAEEVHQSLSGTVGSVVVLTVKRGGETRDIKVERGPLRPSGGGAGASR